MSVGLSGGMALAAPAARAEPSAPMRLTGPESRAIRIASVSAVGDESLGLIVSVTFSGNIGRYPGQGGLGQGLLTLVLEPTSGTARPNGVVDQDGGFTPLTIPVLARSGRRMAVKHDTVEVFSPEHVQRMPVPGQESVLRNGNQVIFYLPALGVTQPLTVKVKIFKRGPIATGKMTTSIPRLTPSAWSKIVQTKPTQVVAQSVTPTQLTVAQLEKVGSELSSVRNYGLEPQLRREQQAHTALQTTISQYAANASLLPVGLGALSTDRQSTQVGTSHLKSEISVIDKMIQRVDALIAETSKPPVEVVQTDSGFSQLLTPQTGLVTSKVKPQGVPIISVNDQIRYQQFGGLGAAMPDSSAWLIYDNLSASNRQALMQALFGSPGFSNALGVPPIHLNFLRLPMAAGGAMTTGAPYSYDDDPPGGADPDLTDFSIAHDLPYIVPTVQQALTVNPGLQILANPWSPPAWMKSNDSLDNSNGQGTLLPSAYGTLADYFVKFIQAYASYGIRIDGITPQNEPSSGQTATNYPGMTLPEPSEAQFIAQDLEPALRAAGLDPKLYGNDLSWESSAYAESLSSDPGAGPDLGGIAWHCYYGAPTVMTQLHQTHPGLDQIVSECSPEIRSFGTPEFLISALRNWASTVSVWAAALDPGGGPIQPNNDCPGCRGPVTINEQNQTVSFRPEYYQLGQISAFVDPGAVRIASPTFVTYGVNSSNIETVSSGLDDVAFLDPDGSKVLITYNNSKTRSSFAVSSNGTYYVYTIPAHAMTTFLWR